MDVTPRGKATQLIGRIRRPVPGKKEAVWVTPRDVRCQFSKRLYLARCKDYAASGAEIVVNGRQVPHRPNGINPVQRYRGVGPTAGPPPEVTRGASRGV